MKKEMKERRYWLVWYLVVLAFLVLQILFYDYITKLFQ